ncbi:MAG: hypothetical protein GX787_04600 [Tissierellia bacterium]|nr:hypothetical protein [Tissierellia bacterium]
MKRLISIGLILILITSLIVTGCSKESTNQTDNKDEVKKQVGADKKILTVDITLPEVIVGDLSGFNEQEYLAENDGINSAKVNTDGSLTLNISKKKHNELLGEIKESLDLTLGDLIESEDTPYIRNIDYTKDYREVTISVDREAYENAFDMTPFIVGMTTGIYQLYLGEEYSTTIIMKDVDNGDEMHSVTYPDVFDE